MRSLFSFLVCLACASNVEAQTLADFKWLEGTWISEDEGYTTIEHWSIKDDSTMVGGSQVKQVDKVLFEEKLSLTFGKDGVWYVAVLPVKEGRFKFTSWAEGSFVVSDPTNDFPSQITYQLTTRGLAITLEGSENDVEKKETFLMQRN